PQEAWEFVKFMTGEEGQKITAIEGGSAPTLADLYDDEEVQEGGVLFSDPDFVDVLENAIPRPVSSIYPKISEDRKSTRLNSSHLHDALPIYPQEAWEFVKFMTGEEGQKITAIEGGSAPTLADLYDDEEVQEGGVLFSDPDFVDVLENAIPRPVSSIYPKIS